ncbi:hypothetical protein DB345_17300 [Spartobacteria bacterium LR76]|nr:hypothetical protein DB345_17300 [Spartobacteria bacterium LR76]
MPSTIADRIKEARRKLKLSQSQAAKEWQISTRTLQEWEQGRHEPQGLALAALESILSKALQSGSRSAHDGRSSRSRVEGNH